VVTKVDTSTFDIGVTSHYGAVSSTPLNRSLGARASVQYAYQPAEATTINGNFSVPANTTITGAVRANGSVTLALGATVKGDIYATSVLGSLLNLTGSVIPISSSGSTNPTPTTIRDYSTYTYNGKTYTAKAITNSASGTLGPTSDNPLGVYVAASDLTLSATVTVNGTVLVPNGSLVVKSSGITINAAANMPALIVKQDLAFSGTTKKLTVNGLSWVGGVLTKSGTTSGNKVVFNGAALFTSASPVSANYSGTVAINYDKTKATAAGFLPSGGTVAYGVKLKSFSNK